jgi:hypothetical protein
MQRAEFIQPEQVGAVLHHLWKDKSTKIHKEALKLSAELLETFIDEALRRSLKVAQDNSSFQLHPDHLNSILAALLLDFC